MRTGVSIHSKIKSILFGGGLPLVSLLFQRWLPVPAALSIGVFLWSMLFYFIPPKWPQRTFTRHFGLSLAMSIAIFAFVSVIESI
jgi:hypothetical protein